MLQSWKHSLFHSIHKTNGPFKPFNFRSISIVPVASKIVERAVHQQLYIYLAKNHHISTTWHDFWPRHSTGTALISASDHILPASDRGALCLPCLLVLSKCVDAIDDAKLLTKRQLYGIDISCSSAYVNPPLWGWGAIFVPCLKSYITAPPCFHAFSVINSKHSVKIRCKSF